MVSRKVPKFVVCLVLVLSVLFIQSGTVLADGANPQVDYVAIGDSLAAGMTPTGGLGLGYPDYIAQKLADDCLIATFKNFGVPGATTSNVLTALKFNVVLDPYGVPHQLPIRETISQAEIVTIDAGANDVLPYLSNPSSVVANIGEARSNLIQIVKEIKLLNPEAKVYVMGYYNPYPYYPEAQQTQLTALLNMLNLNIQGAALSEGAIYVPTAQTMAKHTKLYLPLENIHPSKQGYMAIAKDFWSFIKLDLRGE